MTLARGRRRGTHDQMNRTEGRFAVLLEFEKQAGRIVWYAFEPITFRLAKGTSYTPDFAIEYEDGLIEFVDVKGRKGRGPGGWEDTAKAKIKITADKFPMFVFTGAIYQKTGWIVETFSDGESRLVNQLGRMA